MTLTTTIDDLVFDSLEDQIEVLNGLWYGDGGTGKTTEIAALANIGPIILVNAEAGLKRRALQRRGVDTDNIRVYPRQGEKLTFEGLEQLYWTCKAELEDQTGLIGVCWDSITEIHKLLLDNARDQSVAKAESRGQERDRFFIDRADYGTMSEQLRELLRGFRDLPCHFLITALERRTQDDDGEVSYGPSVNPAIANDLFGFMDVVAHTEVKNVAGQLEYQASFQPVGKYAGKDRFGILPRMLVDPTADRVLAYVLEETDLASDPVMKAAGARRKQQSTPENDGDDG